MMIRWPEKYVGLPFVDHGRDYKGVDCWGLVRLVLAKECGIEVPSYGEISARDLAKVTDTIDHQSNIEPWRPVERKSVQAFDVALMRGRPLHVGIMASPTDVMHVEQKIATVLLPLTHPAIARRLIGFRRHRDLAQRASAA